MKKRWIWVVVPAVALIGIGAVLGMPRSPVTVDTAVLTPQSVEQTVNCTGVVEAGESTGVFAPLPCVIGEVLVQEGQSVEEGDVLAVIDKEATRQLLGSDKASLLTLAAMDTELTAPTQGVVLALNAQEGQPLTADTPGAVLAPRASLQVRISIREKDLPRLKTGMTVRVTGDGFGEKSYDGVLTEIFSAAAATGTGALVEGVVTLTQGQADASLRLGLTAKAAVVIETVEAGLVVPYAAVESDSDGGDYVYLLQDGYARRCLLSVKAQLAEGLLLADTSLQGATVILQPEKITADGMAVTAGEAVQ